DGAEEAVAGQHRAQFLARPPLQRIAVVLREIRAPVLQLAHLARLDRQVRVPGAPLRVDAEARAAFVDQAHALQRPVEHLSRGVHADEAGNARLFAGVAENRLAAIAA